MTRFKGSRLKLYMFTLALLSLSSLVACGQKTPEPPPPLTVEMLKNAEYKSEWPAEGVAKLTDGEYQEEIVPGAASKLIIVVYPDMHAFGDLNGDGVDDAAVVLATSGGGSGTFISLEAVLNDQGRPKHVATASLGDRAQIKSVAIESGEITVDMVTHGPEDPMCCPTLEVTQKYKLEGDTLVQLPSED
jgi:predicted small lipoprotein YifL